MSQESEKAPRESSEGHCSSGPIILGIFDIYRSTLTQSNCLGLSASIFLMGFFNLIFFWIQWRGPVFSRSSVSVYKYVVV